MRRPDPLTLRFAGAVIAFALSGTTSSAQPPPDALAVPQVTLPDALARAGSHPDLAAAEADVRALQGELQAARTFTHNPEVFLEAGPASQGSRNGRDDTVSLSQTFELGGKRGRRAAAASARVDAGRARLDLTRRLLHGRVRRAYRRGIVARQRLTSAREAEAIAEELKTAADERLRLGAGTLLQVNAAAAARGRAVADRLAAERRLREARTELAAAVGDPAAPELEPADEALEAPPPAPDEQALVALALAARADLAALRAETLAAEAEVRLADALAVPDVTGAVSHAREGLEDRRATTFGITIPLPLLNRNQGGRAAARARLERARTVETGARQAAERELRSAVRRYALATSATASFDRDVVERLADNLNLALESFRAGKISLLEFNVVRRDLVETRMAYLDAVEEMVDARAALEVGAGGALGKELEP